MRVLTISGSRADLGLLQGPCDLMNADICFQHSALTVWGKNVPDAFEIVDECLWSREPEMVMLLGDRFEILAAATSAHLRRIPIAHIGGGDVTEGSYDDAMRDCITRMSSIHFVTNAQAEARVGLLMGQKHVHLVGSPGVDFIMHGDWKAPRPYIDPYVVVSYQPETIDGTNEIEEVIKSLPKNKFPVFIMPNPDRGSDAIRERIKSFYLEAHASVGIYESFPHREFLNLLYHCDEFIGNSSAIYYEAPFLGIKTREIGKRQRGRVIPFGDGQASKRIVKILKEWHG